MWRRTVTVVTFARSKTFVSTFHLPAPLTNSAKRATVATSGASMTLATEVWRRESKNKIRARTTLAFMVRAMTSVTISRRHYGVSYTPRHAQSHTLHSDCYRNPVTWARALVLTWIVLQCGARAQHLLRREGDGRREDGGGSRASQSSCSGDRSIARASSHCRRVIVEKEGKQR